MDTLGIVFLVGVLVTAVIGGSVWIWWSRRAMVLDGVIAGKDQEIFSLQVRLAAAETRASEREQAAADRLKVHEESQQKLEDRFRDLTKAALAESVESSQKMFHEMASNSLAQQSQVASNDLTEKYKRIEGLMKPLAEAVTGLKAGHESSTNLLKAEIMSLMDSQKQVAEATSSLRTALQTPAIAGKFGEDSLSRLLSSVGLVEGTHYVIKPSLIHPDTGAELEPDVVFHCADGTSIVIDSKLPMKSYLASCEAKTDRERSPLVKSHVDALKNHIRDLSNKQYDRAIKSLGFTILFCCNEGAFLAALHADPDLLTFAKSKRIFLASPTTLMFLLQMLSNEWTNSEALKNISQIRDVATELNTALPEFVAQYQKVGIALKNTVGAFNESLGSLEEKVVGGAKDLAALGIPMRKEVKLPKKVRAKVLELASAEEEK